MPTGKVTTPAKSAAARSNGARAARTHTLKAAQRVLGPLSKKEQKRVLSDASRYRKAHADREEAIARIKKTEADAKARELIPATEVSDYCVRLVAGFRREIDNLPLALSDMTLTPEIDAPMRALLGGLQQRLRQRLADTPEIVPPPQPKEEEPE